MLYPFYKSIKFKEKDCALWVTLKNIEAVEKWAQKKEELERKIKKNNPIDGRYK